MEEVYQTLNHYLNEICKYLAKTHSFLLDNIFYISLFNDYFNKCIEQLDLTQEVVTNHLTYEEVFTLAREIIGTIDPHYLEAFDELLTNGVLDFSFDNDYNDSGCLIYYENNKAVKKSINVNRVFNYEDVLILVHEFMHYTNGNVITENREYLTEFISIYFEFYAARYLLDKGIPKNEIDYFKRLRLVQNNCASLYQYEIILLAYDYLGNLNFDTISFLQKYIVYISRQKFENECLVFYDCLQDIYEKNHAEIEKDASILGAILSEEFIGLDYRYVLGTILAIYALKYCDFQDIVYLNNHLNEYNDKTISQICLSIGIDLNDEHFLDDLKLALDDFVNRKPPQDVIKK